MNVQIVCILFPGRNKFFDGLFSVSCHIYAIWVKQSHRDGCFVIRLFIKLLYCARHASSSDLDSLLMTREIVLRRFAVWFVTKVRNMCVFCCEKRVLSCLIKGWGKIAFVGVLELLLEFTELFFAVGLFTDSYLFVLVHH